jgi:hypothetical protein
MDFKTWLLQEEVQASIPFSVLKKGFDDILLFNRRAGRYDNYPPPDEYNDRAQIDVSSTAYNLDNPQQFMQAWKDNPEIAHSDVIPIKLPPSVKYVDQAKNPRYIIFYIPFPHDTSGSNMGGALVKSKLFKDWPVNSKEYPIGIVMINPVVPLPYQMHALEHEIRHYLDQMASHNAPEKIRFGPRSLMRGIKQRLKQQSGINKEITDEYYMDKPIENMSDEDLQFVGLNPQKELARLNKIISKGTPEEKKDAIYKKHELVRKFGNQIDYSDQPIEVYSMLTTIYDGLKNDYVKSLLYRNPKIETPVVKPAVEALIARGNNKDNKKNFLKYWIKSNNDKPIYRNAAELIQAKNNNPELFRYWMKALHKNFVEKDLDKNDLLKAVYMHGYMPALNKFRVPKVLRPYE